MNTQIRQEVFRLYQLSTKKLNEYDFDYLFFNENQQKYLDLCVRAINKLHRQEADWINDQMQKLSIAFVMQKLEHENLTESQQ